MRITLTDQAVEFANGEGDRWFARSRTAGAGYSIDDDDMVARLLDLPFAPERIVDLGCGAGDRLAALCRHYGAAGLGIEPSADAVAHARQVHPGIDWRVGTMESRAAADIESADLVVVGGVMCWIAREQLMDAVANIVRPLRPGGVLALGDFLPDVRQRRRYHHRDDVDLYTWKMDYTGLFLATGLFRVLDRTAFDYASALDQPTPGAEADRYEFSLLERVSNDSWITVPG